MPRPIRAVIDASALRHNFLVARRHAGAARVWAVVKAHAYGHGLLRAARALADLADGFAMLDLAEAAALRDAGFAHPILLLEGYFSPQDLEYCAERKLTPVVHSPEQARMLALARLEAPLPVYLKVNSGMNRLGLSAADYPRVREMLAQSGQAGPLTLMTHFADADGARGIDWQLERFRAVVGDGVGNAIGNERLPVSLANSATLLAHPDALGDWVRPGIMLYGSSPFADRSAAELGLLPAMSLESEIISVRELAAGEAVGYGCAYRADASMRLGIVACGYADGYPRHAPTGTPVLVAGQRARLVGRVSMDMIAVDLTQIPQAGVGSPVGLWGPDLSVDEVAHAAGTIGYELLTALAPRVPVVEKA